MRGVWKLRFVPSLLVLGALLFLVGGGDLADAAPFKPRLSASVSPSSPGVPADLTTDFGWGNALEFFPDPNNPGPGTPDRESPASFASFTPATWGIPDCSPTATCPYPIGTKTGTVNATTTAGLLNDACQTPIPVVLDGQSQPPYPGNMATTPLINATTDNSPGNTITAGTNFLNLTNDNNSSQIMDGAEFWNNLLAALALPAPRERQVANTNLFGTNVWVDVLHYNPGDVAPAALGFATLLIIENFNPAQTPTPGLITDSCGLSSIATQLGQVDTDPGAGTTLVNHRVNPSTPSGGLGTKFFFLNSSSGRDADQGPAAPDEPTGPTANSRRGFVNDDDTCPFVPNVGSPHESSPFDGDSFPNPNAPPPFASDLDGLDAACDPNPTAFDGTDTDADIFLNRGDNCPFTSNGVPSGAAAQADTFELGPLDANEVGAQPVDGGPRNDGIGNACDLNPTVADGHFHGGLKVGPLCITGPGGPPIPGGAFADPDGDGYCSLEEVGLGSNPFPPAGGASTPEVLAVPSTCSDGVDNDGDGNADLADGAGGSAAPTACQLPAHDLAIKKLTGNTIICSSGGGGSKAEMTLQVVNNQTTSENMQVGVILDSVPSYVPSGPYDVSKFGGYDPGKSAGAVTSIQGGQVTVTGSGPINIDGDADVEWLARATVTNVNPAVTTSVHIKVDFPACAAGPDTNPVDYTMTVDICHGNDIAPLGLFGATDCGAAGDGGQDRVNRGNDAPITRMVNDITR